MSSHQDCRESPPKPLVNFIAMEACRTLSNEIAGLRPFVLKRGRPTIQLTVDFDIPNYGAADSEALARAIRPAVAEMVRAVKRGHIKRFVRGELPYHVECAAEVAGCGVAIMFYRFFDVLKLQMVNRLQILGAVRH